MDIDECVCPRPPTIVKRKKSVSRISGCSTIHHETRLSSSLFSLPTEEDFNELGCCHNDMDMSPEKNMPLFHGNGSMGMSPPPHRMALHDHHDYRLDFDRISPTSVMDALYDPMMMTKHNTAKRNFPSVPDLTSSFNSEESSCSSSSSCSIATFGTPSPKRNRQRIQKWSSFHEHGRDWGTSEACDPTVTQELFNLLAMMEEEE